MDIDVVILWVDGSDPEWLKTKKMYSPNTEDDADSVNRYRDWGLMKYWFRGIETFAPWVRTVHLVTCGQVPAFLNPDNPKLHLVRHEDYLPEDALPTFSSHAIEMSMHKIPGLAEHFLYFNDDMFLIRPVSESAFFQDGFPCLNGSEWMQPPFGLMKAWFGATMNNLGIINNHFPKQKTVKANRQKYLNRVYGRKDILRTFLMERIYPQGFVGFRISHGPSAFTKSAFEAVWAAEPAILKETTYRRFRDLRDVNQWLVLWWQIASGAFSPARINSRFWEISTGSVQSICASIEAQSYPMICINDPDQPIPFESLAAQLQGSFEKILPQKCSFEK